MMGTGEASGEARATQAAEAAINNPLLDDTTMKGANAVLINITGGLDMTLFEVDEAANRIRKEVDPDATIIFGSAFDDKLDGVMRVSVVATGISRSTQFNSRPNNMSKKTNAISPSPEKSDVKPLTSLLNHNIELPESEKIVSTVNSENLTKTAPNSAEKPQGLENQLSNELANQEIADIIDTQVSNSAQMDIHDAINPALKKNENGFDQNISENINNRSLETNFANNKIKADDGLLTSLITNTGEETNSKARFIPRVAASIPDEESIIKSAGASAKHTTGLINRISGLWSSKPANKEPTVLGVESSDLSAKEKEVKDQIAASILDVSQSKIVTGDTEFSAKPNISSHEEELDIPAFLRRQAN
jgi:cell division protein FtsZ